MQNRWDVPWVPSRPDNNLRIGDAERNEVSELLSKHYSDGRLDAAEFQERLDKAMSAKTRSDLSGFVRVGKQPAHSVRSSQPGSHAVF